MVIGFALWGVAITEWAAILSITVSLFGGLAWMFQRIVVKPLTDSMNNLTKQLEESSADRKLLHDRVSRAAKRIDKHDGHFLVIDKRLDYIEDDIKELKQ